MTLEGDKVVTAAEMARIEKLAYAAGESELTFMQNAGAAIAAYTAKYIEGLGLEREVTLFVGKGNNGGDAFTAGALLLEQGFSVVANHFFSLDSCSPLCQLKRKEFEQKGGKVHFVQNPAELICQPGGVLLDGLVGTGFKGRAEGVLGFAIECANGAGLPIIAIDIPSGLDSTTGEVCTVAIEAVRTLYLGLPKIGFFIGRGWDFVGKLVCGDFGLPERFVQEAKAEAYLLNCEELPTLLPKIKRTRHKYEAGYLLAVCGSPGMCGAAILSTFAAMRSGAGIVRLFYPAGLEEEMSRAAVEVVKEAIHWRHPEPIFAESKRAAACMIGPGMGRSKETKELLKKLFSKLSLPCVLDADALFFLAKYPRWKLPAKVILTPHKFEMERLLGGFSGPSFHAACQAMAEKKQCTIILKGAPTFIFHPQTAPLIITTGDPGMATAGSGDVLTGVVAALVAQKLEMRTAAALGAYIHGLAGERAAELFTSYSLVASDIIAHLSDAFFESK